MSDSNVTSTLAIFRNVKCYDTSPPYSFQRASFVSFEHGIQHTYTYQQRRAYSLVVLKLPAFSVSPQSHPFIAIALWLILYTIPLLLLFRGILTPIIFSLRLTLCVLFFSNLKNIFSSFPIAAALAAYVLHTIYTAICLK